MAPPPASTSIKVRVTDREVRVDGFEVVRLTSANDDGGGTDDDERSASSGFHRCKTCNWAPLEGLRIRDAGYRLPFFGTFKEHMEVCHSGLDAVPIEWVAFPASYKLRLGPLAVPALRVDPALRGVFADALRLELRGGDAEVAAEDSSSGESNSRKRKSDEELDPGEGPSRPWPPPPRSPSAAAGGGGGGDPSKSSLDKFLHSSQTLLECLREKKQKEKGLERAQKLQTEARSCRLDLDEIVAESAEAEAQRVAEIAKTRLAVRQLTARLAAQEADLEKQRNTARDRRREVEARLRSVEERPGAMTAGQIAALKEELQQMADISSEVKDALGVPRSFDDSDVCKTVQCPVCLEVPPGQVFSCQQCSNLLCQECSASTRVEQCPSCRQSFESLPARRNVLAERIIASVRDAAQNNSE